MTDKIVVFTTCANEDEAGRIASSLVEKRLAACVSIMPKVSSVYRWNGAIERSEEVLLIIKSSRGNFSRLRSEIERMHSYQVPEIIALPVVDGADSYLEWMTREMLVSDPMFS